MENSSEDDYYYTDCESDFSSDFSYSQMMLNMEMNFYVNLPYKVVDSNAPYSVLMTQNDKIQDLLYFKGIIIDNQI